MCRKFYLAFFLSLCLALFWCSETSAQSFPYHLSLEMVPGQCYDDARLIFTLTDDNGNVVQIDPQTHNVVSTAPYPLYNVQYHYQNVSSGLGVQYDYNNNVMLTAGTYNVGVRGYIPLPNGTNAMVDTTVYNFELTTTYQHLEAAALFNLATSNTSDHEMSGWRPSFTCADLGRIQLHITQGSFPYEVTILNEQQDTIRHSFFSSRVNNGNLNTYADYRDYYTFDQIPVGTYSIFVSDSCGYTIGPISFTIPNAEPSNYGSYVDVKFYSCPSVNAIPFSISIYHTSEFNNPWHNYTHTYFDSILQYRFINPENDTTEWRKIPTPSGAYSNYFNRINDTLSSFCVIFNDTVTLQVRDLCHDTTRTYRFLFLPQFDFIDSVDIIHVWDSAVQDTCAVHLQSGVSTQTYKIGGSVASIFSQTGASLNGLVNQVRQVPFRYYRCPLSYKVWSMPDFELLGHSESDEFTGLGTWVSFNVDTTVQLHYSVTDAVGCEVASKDTILVFNPEPLDELYPWFECHNEIDDDGKDHCCADRYLWIQEHGVDASTFRRDMTLHLIESPLYNHYNYTAIRQNGVWNITFDDPTNHSSYVEFSYPDGWRATLRDTVCLPPGRYKFEVSTACGVDTIVYEWAGFYYDTHEFASAPQYEIEQVCDHIVVTQVSTGVEGYVYFIDPSVSNDMPIQESCHYAFGSSSSSGIYPTEDSQGRKVYSFSIPGTYYITNYSYNQLVLSGVHTGFTDCIPYIYHYDTLTVAFSYLDFEMAFALLCDTSATTGIVTAQAINGNEPYTYTLYDQWGAAGNVIASNSTGFFDNVPMTEGQQFSVQVTDSCLTTFSINITAALLVNSGLLWGQDVNSAVPHCVGDTVHLNTLNFPPPATYQWTGPNGFISTSQSVDIVLTDVSQTGWYYVEILNTLCGPVISDSVYITVVPAPQTIVIYDTICQWAGYEENGFAISAGETSVPGEQVFTRLEQNGYFADTILLNLLVTPSTDTIIHVSANGSYMWNGNTYTTSGAYNRVADGCRKETLLLTVIDTLQVTLSADDDTLCRGEETSLHALVTNAYGTPPVAVGDILCTDGDIVKPSAWPVAGKTALGVVFYVDNTGAHGWAVHLHDQDTSVRWFENGYYSDIPGLANCTYPYLNNMDMDGYANTQVIRAFGTATTCPAAWAVDFPNGWYLPAIGQLRLLYGTFNTINSTLQMLNGTPFQMETDSRYWSSTENDTWYAFELRWSGAIGTNLKAFAYRVRSIRDF